MAKQPNAAGSETVRITLSSESLRLLDELAEKGIYGRNRAEVAGRFVDAALQGFVEQPRLRLREPEALARGAQPSGARRHNRGSKR